MFDWDRDNVIVTGSSYGVVRVSTCTHMLLWQPRSFAWGSKLVITRHRKKSDKNKICSYST